MAEEILCECMDGPNHVDATCLYCGGTGIYASDERLADLIRHYTYLVENSDGISRRQFKASDQQHVAIFKALQFARADEMRRVRDNIARPSAILSDRQSHPSASEPEIIGRIEAEAKAAGGTLWAAKVFAVLDHARHLAARVEELEAALVNVRAGVVCVRGRFLISDSAINELASLLNKGGGQCLTSSLCAIG